MGEMTLPSKRLIRNSSPGGLTPSTLPLGHGREGKKHFVSLPLEGQRGVRTSDLLLSVCPFNYLADHFPEPVS